MHAFQGMDEDKGPQSRKLYLEVPSCLFYHTFLFLWLLKNSSTFICAFSLIECFNLNQWIRKFQPSLSDSLRSHTP